MSPAPRFALLLSGAPRDLAALDALCRVLPVAPDARWTELTPRAPIDPPAALTSPALGADLARRLHELGAPVARLTRSARGALLTPLDPARPPDRWRGVEEREAASLLEAVRPRPRSAPTRPFEAMFCVDAEHPEARRTIDRLLALGREDVSAQLLAGDGARTLAMRVTAPPMYLLLRADEEPAEGVTAFTRRSAEDPLWVRWGYAHPLAESASIWLRRNEIDALVERDGRWLTLARDPPRRTIHELVAPRLDGARVTLRASDEVPRFEVRLRVERGAASEPEAWLLDDQQLLAMGELVATLPGELLERATLCRLRGDDGARYLLRAPRPHGGSIAAWLERRLDAPGFARAPGVEGLLLRAGARLVPALRPEQLRALFDLDAATLTLVDFGPRVVHVRGDAAWTLGDWVDLVATDHREVLDALVAESVFDWPQAPLEPVPAAAIEPPEEPQRELEFKRSPSRSREPEGPPEATREEVVGAPPEAPPSSTRRRLDEAERSLLEGPRDHAEVWLALARMELDARELDAAASCAEAAVFYGSDDALPVLTRARRLDDDPASLDGASVELARRGALALARLAAGALDDLDLVELARPFDDPDARCTRWLAWSVLRAASAARRDCVGLTRAKERVLGAVNARGLRDDVDLPRFMRSALSHSRDPRGGDSLRALEALWSVVASQVSAAAQPTGALARAIFSAGFTRLHASARAHDLAPEAGLRHDAATEALLRLYRAFPTLADDAAAWRAEVDATLRGLRDDPRATDRVEHLRKRSDWLATPSTPGAPRRRPAIDRALAALDGDPRGAPAAMRALVEQPSLYDLERAGAIEAILDLVIHRGDEALLGETVSAALTLSRRSVRSSGARARALGACLRAAASLGDHAAVDLAIESLAGMTDLAELTELLDAIGPARAALRRLDAAERAAPLDVALERAAARGGGEAPRLLAAAAEGATLRGEHAQADALLTRAADALLEVEVDAATRFQGARALAKALRALPLAARGAIVERIARGLDRFVDQRAAGSVETYKVLLVERLVDVVADEERADEERLRALLDEEELALRRRIIADWRASCGP